MNAKRFSLACVLSVTTQRLLCPFADMQELFEHLLSGPVFTHELIAASGPAKAVLIEQFPILGTVGESDVEQAFASAASADEKANAADAFMQRLFDRGFPAEFSVAPIADYRRTKSPFETAREVFGDKAEVIGVVVAEARDA